MINICICGDGVGVVLLPFVSCLTTMLVVGKHVGEGDEDEYLMLEGYSTTDTGLPLERYLTTTLVPTDQILLEETPSGETSPTEPAIEITPAATEEG